VLSSARLSWSVRLGIRLTRDVSQVTRNMTPHSHTGVDCRHSYADILTIAKSRLSAGARGLAGNLSHLTRYVLLKRTKMSQFECYRAISLTFSGLRRTIYPFLSIDMIGNTKLAPPNWNVTLFVKPSSSTGQSSVEVFPLQWLGDFKTHKIWSRFFLIWYLVWFDLKTHLSRNNSTGCSFNDMLTLPYWTLRP